MHSVVEAASTNVSSDKPDVGEITHETRCAGRSRQRRDTATWRAFNTGHHKSDHEEAEEINGRRDYPSWSRRPFISSGSLQRRINA